MLVHYFSTSLRSIRHSPYIAAMNVASLALGLACFLGAFAAVGYIEMSDRQLPTADRAFAITQRIYSADGKFDTGYLTTVSPNVAKYLKIAMPGLEAVARAESMGEVESVAGVERARLVAMGVDADFLKIFPFELTQGITATVLKNPRSIVLTPKAARRLFGNVNPVGKTVLLQNSLDVQVTGVLRGISSPSQFEDLPSNSLRFDFLASMDVVDVLRYGGSAQRAQIPELPLWASLSGLTYGLLPESNAVTLDGINRALTNFAERYVPSSRRQFADFNFRAVPTAEVWKSAVNATLFRGSNLSITWLLQLLGGLVLATACLNYANLAAASTGIKLKETGLRRVLGARGVHVVAQSVIEVALLALCALVVAVAALALVSPILRAATGIDINAMLTGSSGVWLCALASVLGASLIAGSYPALLLVKSGPANAMRQRARGQSKGSGRLLVGSQFAAASFLLLSLIVVISQGHELRQRGLAAGAEQTLIVGNTLSETKLSFATLRAELLDIPGVTSVAAVDDAPWAYSSNSGAIGTSMDVTSSFVSPFVHTVTPGFDSALGMRILAGRGFDERYADDFFDLPFPDFLKSADPQRLYSVMIDRQIARELGWKDPVDAVDQVAYMPFAKVGGKDLRVKIIGVVEDKPLRLVGSGTTSNMFVASKAVWGHPLIRVNGTAVASTLKSIEDVWNRMAPQAPLQRRFLDEQFDMGYQLFDRISRIVSGVALFAFLISLLGLFGMAVFIANGRRHEIGVRKTIGASVTQILAMLLRDFSKPVIVANLAVWPLAYLAANAYLNIFTHRMELTATPFIASLVVTLLVAWIAVGGQAWRAARVKPGAVMRYE